jgi:signal transduction histidine kinase
MKDLLARIEASPKSSIRKKLIAMSLWASCGALVLASAAFMTFDLLSYRASLIRAETTLSEIISVNVSSALVFNDAASATKTLSSLSARDTLLAAGIYTTKDKLFAEWHRNTENPRVPPPLPVTRSTSHYFRHHALVLFHPIVLDKSIIGMIYIESDTADLIQRFERYLGIVLIVMTISFVVAIAISLRVSEKILRPVLKLTELAKVVSEQKNYAVRAPESGTDEIGLLLKTFNQMLIKIQADQEEIRLLNEQLEQKVLQRTAELMTSNKELEAFSYSVSHDLRTPLRAIDGFSRELIESAGARLGEFEKDDLRRIRAATQRMAQLIDDLLKLSRVTRGDIIRETLNLSAIVDKVLSELKVTNPGRVVETRVEPSLMVIGDPHLLRLAIENLIGNAWKFTERCAQAKIEFGSTEHSGRKAFFVRDNGAGFNMAYSAKLFGAFQRLHDTKDFPGTGIGLATVQRIINRHGGQIWAQAEVGRGAVFYFTL